MKRGEIEIKIQGFGGQGTVMATDILAAVMSKAGYHIQSFSQYGSQRRGGHVSSYLRISTDPILTHSQIYEPDYLVLAHESFLEDRQITSCIKDHGIVLVNAPQPVEDTCNAMKLVSIITLDADRIALKHNVLLPSGLPVINTALVGGFVALFPDVPFHLVEEVLREKKLPSVEKNIAAAQEAFQYVRGGHEVLHEVVAVREGILEKRKNPVAVWRQVPCESQCPAGVPVREFIKLMEQGKIRKALAAIKAENPFPGICGRACFNPCESACNRNQFDEGVAINGLERAAYDYGVLAKVKTLPSVKPSARKVAVIGSGPAGLTCAYFSRLFGYHCTIFEALPVPGGIPRIAIPAYRLPRDVVDRQIHDVLGLGVELKMGVKVERKLFDEIMAAYDACFLATGAHQPTPLAIPGENAAQVQSALQFLKEVGLGEEAAVSGRVAVIGGGNTAVDAARTAKRLGAKEVTIVYRRSEKEMPAYDQEVFHAKDEGVSMLCLAAPVRISKNGQDTILECIRMALLDEHGEDGRRQVAPVEGSTFMLEVDRILVAAGELVHVPFLPDTVRRNGSLVDTDTFGRTSVRGLFAGGDAATFSRSIAHAIGAGKRAAIGIDLFLRGRNGGNEKKEFPTMAAYLSQFEARKEPVALISDLNLDYFHKSAKTLAEELAPEVRSTHFNEVRKVFSRKRSVKEAARCLSCGECVSCGNCYIFCPDIAVGIDDVKILPEINHEFCKGCGICLAECPHGVLGWERG